MDIRSNDLGFVAIAENGKLVGFNVLVGGGLSSEHGNTKTYPNISYEFGFVPLNTPSMPRSRRQHPSATGATAATASSAYTLYAATSA